MRTDDRTGRSVSNAGFSAPVRRTGKMLFASCLFILLSFENGGTQSLNGTTGLIAIPTAEILNDGEVMIGGNWVDKDYNVRMPTHDQHRYFIAMGYLPFLEVSLRLTRNYRLRLSDYSIEWPGDRGASIRLRLLNEKKNRPSVVLGAHDFYSAFGETKTVWFNALYLVGTKKFQTARIPIQFGLSLGVGTDWMKAKHHELTGVFGGCSMDYRGRAMLMLEHDSEKVNGGMQLVFFRRIRLLFALLHLDSFAGGASYSFALR
jgi:hypothetical protein